MYAKLKQSVSEKDVSTLRKFVDTIPPKELSDIVSQNIVNAEAPKVISALLAALSHSENRETKKQKIVETILKSVCKAKASTCHVDCIISRIILDLPQYTKLNLVKIIEFCQERICLNDDDFMSWKDILPAALESLQDQKCLNYKGNEVSGPEYKSLVVKSICDKSLATATLIPLAKMFGEMSLDKDDRALVIRALCDRLPDMELNEIPPLVHQLLGLQFDQDGQIVLGTLQKYFSVKYSSADDSQGTESSEEIGVVSRKEIGETESTVLYHIYQASQVNQTNFKGFVTTLKKVTNAPEYILDPFLMAVLLLMSSMYDDQIFEILKNAINRKIQDDKKRKNSAWLRSVLSDDWHIIDVVEQVIANSNKDRHLALKGLVELAFVLMSGERRTKDDSSQLYEIGIRIIQKLIRKRHEIGAMVLQKLTAKIVGGGSTISQYTDCLSYICRKLTLIVLDSQMWVITLLEQLLAIPGDAATQVLHAILPLVSLSATIRDSLVLVLRKALHRKGTHTRKMAVIGFLELLRNLKINSFNSLSQSGQSSSSTTPTTIFTQVILERRNQTTESSSECNVALCHEVLRILKRCFTHEVGVRLHLYRGLHDGVRMNPELSDYVMDILITHFNIYYETDRDVKPPLKFHLCSESHGMEVVLREPIGDLIFAMQRIYLEMASQGSSSAIKVSTILESLCERMTRTKLADLNLDDNTDLLADIPKSEQKLHSLKLTITVYEALMAYKIGCWSVDSVDVAQNISNLFTNYKELVDFSMKVVVPKKAEGSHQKDKDANDTTTNKRSGRVNGVKLPETIMDLDTIHKMLSLLYEPCVSWASKEEAAILKERTDFCHYILQTAVELFHVTKALKNADRQRHQELYLKNYLDIAELLYKHIISDPDNVRDSDQQTEVLGLTCFKELCDLFCTSFPSQLAKFLSRTCGIEASMGLSVQTQSIIAALQNLVEAYFQESPGDDPNVKKILVILLETMSIFMHKADLADAQSNVVFGWLHNMAQRTEVETSIMILFIQLLSMIEECNAETGQMVDGLCIELCGKLGTIDKSEISINERYRCLTEYSAAQLHPVLSAAVKSKLNNAAWILGRLKAEQYIANAPGLGDELDREKLREKERSLCRQLSYIIKILQSLASVAIEPGPNTDATFKNIQQLYKLVGDLTKYFLSKSGAQSPAFQSVNFMQLVELAGNPLKLTFYNLISYTEENQNHHRGKADGHAQRNKVIKETKVIPNVVLAIEMFQKELMKLSRKTGIPLENYVKQSITRDFRIKNPELVGGLEKLDISLLTTQHSSQGVIQHSPEKNNCDSDESDDHESHAKD